MGKTHKMYLTSVKSVIHVRAGNHIMVGKGLLVGSSYYLICLAPYGDGGGSLGGLEIQKRVQCRNVKVGKFARFQIGNQHAIGVSHDGLNENEDSVIQAGLVLGEDGGECKQGEEYHGSED